MEGRLTNFPLNQGEIEQKYTSFIKALRHPITKSTKLPLNQGGENEQKNISFIKLVRHPITISSCNNVIMNHCTLHICDAILCCFAAPAQTKTNIAILPFHYYQNQSAIEF